MLIQSLIILLLTEIVPTPAKEIGFSNNKGQFHKRIAGGQDAEDGFAPYQISLQTLPGDHLCGGAIIDRHWIITAGHCVAGWPPEFLRIATGTNRYREPDAIYYPIAIHLHCNYDLPKYANDLALIQLNDTILYKNHTHAIQMQLLSLQENDDVIFTGWGAKAIAGVMSEYLQKLKSKYVTRTICRQMLSNFEDVSVDNGHICALSKEGEGSCHGDNGSPLVSDNKLIGLLNWNIPCATGVPDMFTNVLYYRDWIRTVMSGNRRC